MTYLRNILNWFSDHKLVTLLSLLTFVFFVCTVALGSENAYLYDEVLYFRNLNITKEQPVTDSTTRQIESTANPTEMTTEQPPKDQWRLPANLVRAISYNLTLRPDLETGLFTGTINIEFETKYTLYTVYVNTKGLKITIPETNFQRCTLGQEKNEILPISCEHSGPVWKPGTHTLDINFEGDMKNRIVGLYMSSYKNEKNETRNIATSKLEPTYARQAFPCFDEPNYKAKYTVHLQIPKDQKYIALSNMDQNGEPVTIDEKHQMVSFKESVPMSTYVSCFIVCDFDYEEDNIKSISGNEIPLRVYATPAQKNKTLYALKVSKLVTEYYEEYFNISYPLPKLDMIAIPDFVSGAMEHWGLVTYRETALLFDNETGNAANKQRVATVVAHELAHMWFGNLVTLDWWNDLWLNEGFATYMQFKAINDLNKAWGMGDQFLIDELHPVLDFDSTLATHPIVVTVTTPDQITEIFDSISYNKGASILRMLENAIGEEKFRQGIRSYLLKHAYKNAVTQDLWKELQATEPGFQVQEVMDTWTILEGYPIIEVSYNKDKNKLSLRQSRFLQNPDSAVDMPSKKYEWHVPITYTTDLDPENEILIWFNVNNKTVEFDIPNEVKWVKLNSKQVGYYRVQYTPDLWKNLTKAFKDLQPSDQANLLEDSFSIARTGLLNYAIPLDISEKMIELVEGQDNYVPWTVTLRKFSELKTLLKNNHTIYDKYKKFVQSVVNPIYSELGWSDNTKTTDGIEEDEDKLHQPNLLRAKILSAACSYDVQGEKPAKLEARSRFQEWLKEEQVVLDVSEKAIIYAYGMEQATRQEWDQMFERYVKETDAAEKLKLLNGLASVKNKELLNILIDRADNEDIVRKQDYFTCLQYISSNDEGTDLVWLYVRENWEKLVDRFTLNDRYLGRLIPSITSSFATTTRLEEMEAFFKKYPEAGAGETSRKQALETVRNNISWVKKYQKDVEAWLDKSK